MGKNDEWKKINLPKNHVELPSSFPDEDGQDGKKSGNFPKSNYRLKDFTKYSPFNIFSWTY